MALPARYPSSDNNELHEKLKWSFSCAIEKSEFLKQSKDIKTIEGWYSQAKKTSDNISNPSLVSSEMIKELLNHVYPHYTNIIIEKTDINIKSTDGGVQSDLDLGIVTMRPYIEFVKIVNGESMPPSKFTFQLDIRTYISIFKAVNNSASENIELKKLGIELEISLLHMPYFYLSEPMKLTTKTFEIENIRLPRKMRI
jgi:hypothetical protein